MLVLRAILLSLACLFCLAAGAVERRFVLRDYLNQSWSRELVTFTFTEKAGACHQDSLALTGPDGPQAMQLSEVVLWPHSSSIKSAKVSFIADVAPLGTSTYALSYGRRAIARQEPRTDLVVVRRPEFVELRTTQFGLLLPLGAKTFQPAVPAAQAPVPVQAMFLGNAQFSGSRLFGEKKIRAFAGKLTAAGPVYAEAVLRYTYEDDTTLAITARLAAGDTRVQWATAVTGDAPDDGWQLLMFQPHEAVRLPWKGEFGLNKWGKLNEQVDVALEKEPAGDITRLTPWNDWWDGTTQTAWIFKNAAGAELLAAQSLDAGAWVEPVAAGTLRNWAGWQYKLLPLRKLEDGTIALHVNNATGARKWALGGAATGIGHRLNIVKDYVLSWPEDADTHPHMFMTKAEMEEARARRKLDQAQLTGLKNYWIAGLYKSGDGFIPSYHDTMALGAYLLTGDPQVGKDAKVLERFRNAMMIQGKFDTMRYTCMVTEYYDTLIDDPLTPEAERENLRALFAYLGYKLADPATWSCERGYRSYNLNMSVANVLNVGMVASAIPTHPMAKEWVKPALAMTDDILKDVGPAGEFPESVTNYAGVTTSALLAFAIAAKNAGFHDYVNDPRMKRLLLWHTKQYTPPDPRSGGSRIAGLRALPPHGRAGAGNRESLAGVMARATLKSDPAYAKALQWAWLQSGAPTLFHDSRMGGLEYLYLDKTLPAARPDWGSEVYPLSSVMLRHGFDTPSEHQINLVCGDFSHAIFPGEGGAFAGIWSHGVPVSSSFAGGYSERDELLMSKVLIARDAGAVDDRKKLIGYCGFPYNLEESSTGKRVVTDTVEIGGRDGIINVAAFSTLPRQDYAAVDMGMRYSRGASWEPVKDLPAWPATPKGKAPVDWRRQMLFLKDGDPAGPTYLLLRDTVIGNQPTMWQMWTISETVDTPERVKDVAAVLANKPGKAILPARELKGDRFTAIGQFGVDVEYFIASPTDTPRHTLRWGTKYGYSPIPGFEEYHDLLHLQMPKDGAYFVAFYPRERAQPAPAFATLGGGHVIKVSGEWGVDYGFLAFAPAKADADTAHFDGTAASVQDRKSGLVLCLGAKGEVRYREYGLAASGPASLRVKDAASLEVTLPAGERAHALTITAPGQWELGLPMKGVTFSKNTLIAPPGVTAVSLKKVK
ncbi:MAG: hypothetical protein BWY76_00220 [bacterium ADurb.Bin429]|nr:MAG: hypothetical protein BWY76_00220 [bacterium ADurb.Bin429]